MNQKHRSNKIPPQQNNPRYAHKFRFSTTGLSAVSITAADLIGIGGGICTLANTTLSVFALAFKLTSVEIWTPVVSAGTPATCSVEWTSTNANTPPFKKSDTSTVLTENAHVYTKPPQHSVSAFWQFSSTNVMFGITAPNGSIIEVSISYIFRDDNVPVTRTITSGTLNATYWLGLAFSSGGNAVPIGLQTTT